MSSHVPSDIEEEIIKTLPAKSLIRFRSVCKTWKSLIKRSEFIADYSVRHTRLQHLLISYKIGHWPETNVTFVDDDTFPKQKFIPTVPRLLKKLDANRLTIIGSSHGLLCYFYRGRQKDDMAVLWNPSVRKSIGVVIPDVVNEPFSSVLGFGVCPNTGDPKLVKVTFIWACWKTQSIIYIPWQVMVFSLSSKKWTIPCNSLPRISIAFRWSHTVIGEFIYWFALDWRDAEDGVLQYHNLIMSFDMTTEEFREVNLPDSLVPLPSVSLSISRLRDSLALLEYTQDITWKQVCGVWIMKHGDPKVFTKLYTIKQPHVVSIQTTLGFRKSGEPVIHREVDGRSRCVVYEPLSENFMDIGILANRGSISMNSYTESLLLLNEEDGRQYLPLQNVELMGFGTSKQGIEIDIIHISLSF